MSAMQGDNGGDRQAGARELQELLLLRLGRYDPQRRALQQDLEARLAHDLAGKSDDTPEQAREWLRSAKRKPGWWRAAGAILLLSCLALEFYQQVPLLAVSSTFSTAGLRKEALRRAFTGPPEGAAYHAFVDYRDFVAGAERGWRGHPDDPAFYALYVEKLLQVDDRLPERFEATWRRLDPENGLWLLYRADALWRQRTEPPHAEEAMALIREAAGMPHVKFHHYDLARTVTEETRQPRTTEERTLALLSRHNLLYQPYFEPAKPLLSMVAHNSSSPQADRDASEKILAAYRADSGRQEKLSTTSYGNEWQWERQAVMLLLGRWTLLGMAMFLTAVAGLLKLRGIPAREAAGRLAQCVAALWRPGDAWKIALLGLAAPLGMGTMLCYGADQGGYLLGGLVPWLPLPLLLAVLAGMVTVANLLMTRRMGFLGMGLSRRRLAGNALMTGMAYLAVVLPGLMLAAERFGFLRPGLRPWLSLAMAQQICGGEAGLVLLWLMVRVMLGYASPEASLRHRVLARGLAPACLAMAVMLCVLALFLHPLERMEVRPLPPLPEQVR